MGQAVIDVQRVWPNLIVISRVWSGWIDEDRDGASTTRGVGGNWDGIALPNDERVYHMTRQVLVEIQLSVGYMRTASFAYNQLESCKNRESAPMQAVSRPSPF